MKKTVLTIATILVSQIATAMTSQMAIAQAQSLQNNFSGVVQKNSTMTEALMNKALLNSKGADFFHIGNEGGGGGKIVSCSADGSEDFPQSGYYALDFVLASRLGQEWYVAVPDFQGQMDAVIEVFKTKLRSYFPKETEAMIELAKNFDNSWYPLSVPLKSTGDQAIGEIAKNCSHKVLQLTTKVNAAYFYDPNLFGQLAASGQKQIDAHKMHEFLRVAFSDSNKIALWNYVIHSRSFYTMKASELVGYLNAENMGLIDATAKEMGDLRIGVEKIVAGGNPDSYETNEKIVQFLTNYMTTTSRKTLADLRNKVAVLKDSRQAVDASQLCALSKAQDIVVQTLRKQTASFNDQMIAIFTAYGTSDPIYAYNFSTSQNARLANYYLGEATRNAVSTDSLQSDLEALLPIQTCKNKN